MSLEWETYTVEELVNKKMLEKPLDGNHGGIHPKSTDYVDEGVPFIMANDLKNGSIDYENCKYISEEQSKTLKKGFSKHGDVLLTHKATIGRTAIVDDNYDTVILTPQVTYYRVLHGINNYYLYFYFNSVDFQNILENWSSSGSTRKYIGISSQLKLPIILPPLEIQNNIVEILSSIDKKIEINEKINRNLKAQLETIYNSFFVYYDYFSKEDLEECGLIPKNWDLKSLGEVTTKINEKVGDRNYKVFSAVNTGNLILSEEYFDKQVFSKSIEKYIVVKQKEFAYNPARINIGSIGRNDFDYDGCVSPVYVAFKVEEGYENFMNMYIKSNRFNQWVVTLSSGSVRQTLNYNDFSIIKIAYPPKDLVNKFNRVYENFYEVINYNNSVIVNLEKIRDILLPKLMSGEIDVSQINCDLE